MACLLIAVLAGCDLIAPGRGATEVSGVITDASHGRPLEGLSVALKTGGWAGGSAVATATTDAEGRYRLRADWPGTLDLRVNSDPYDVRYHTEYDAVGEGRRETRSFRIFETARLTIRAETDTPLLDGDWYTVNAGCLTGEAPFTTECMRGNDWNEIRLRVRRRGALYVETVIPVYVRAGEDNVYTVRY